MKKLLRLSLPPASQLHADSLLAFALLDRHRQILQAGELPLRRLLEEVPHDGVQAILHPDDAIMVTQVVPAVARHRLREAVLACVEGLALSELDELCVAHGPRQGDGQVVMAWATQATLEHIMRCLADCGLRAVQLIPLRAVLDDPEDPTPAPLALPADARWQAPAPTWSLTPRQWRSGGALSRWLPALRWSLAALFLCVLGLQWQAAQLRHALDQTQAGMTRTVQQAFPDLPVILDPLRQAQSQLDALRLAQGLHAEDDFLPLALAASRAIPDLENKVQALRYADHSLLLTLEETFVMPTTAALQQAARTHNLLIEIPADAPHVLQIRQNRVAASNGQGS